MEKLVAVVVDEAHCVKRGKINLEQHLHRLEIYVVLFPLLLI